MNKKSNLLNKMNIAIVLFLFLTQGIINNVLAQDTPSFKEYKGYVVDNTNDKPLSSATVSIPGTNISTITNDEGEFLIKVPQDINNDKIKISYLGYKDIVVQLSAVLTDDTKFRLSPTVTELSEVNIDPKDPNALMRAVMKNRGVNYLSDNTIMTAFYRETIKKKRTYVSLSEAVVDVYKNPYVSGKNDEMKLYKARKSTDYKKLDTLTLKLMGGPSSTLQIDVMKNPESLFTENMLDTYDFKFDKSTKINDRLIYVLNFEQKPSIQELLYYGKVYIDAESLAMTKAVFDLKLDDKDRASQLFVRKKPANAKVYPTQATYTIDYRNNDGKWYYGYGRIELAFKVNWKKKLFNTNYKLNVEMAVTDWKKNIEKDVLRPKDRLKSTVVISDEASGFSDPEFWGEYNVIEPEKSIESAIKKIQRQLKRAN